MRKWVFVLISLTALSSGFAGPGSAHNRATSDQLQKCLLECYGVDSAISDQIMEKFSPLLEKQEYDPVIESFIEESNKLHLYSTPPSSSGLSFPPFHPVLYENDYLRISWAVTKSGQQEPLLVHPWKTLMVVVRPSQFYSVGENGDSFEDFWPIGTYLLDPSPDRFSCKNIGHEEYNGIVFEIKTSSCFQ